MLYDPRKTVKDLNFLFVILPENLQKEEYYENGCCNCRNIEKRRR